MTIQTMYELNVLTRRQFLSSCAGCSAAAACLGISFPTLSAAADPPASDKVRVRLVYSHISPEKPTWPNRGYDYESRKKELTAKLQQDCPYAEFLPVTVQNADEAKKVLEADREVDGYLVYMVGLWTGAPRTIAASGKPTIFVDDLYSGSGEFLIEYAAAKRQGLRVAGVSSSRFQDVADAVKTLDCLKRLRSSVIVDITARDPGETGKAIQQVFGTPVHQVSAEEVTEAFNQASPAGAKDRARQWIQDAERVVEPSTAEIEKSAAMYMALESVLEKNRSQAVTIDCLSLLYGGKLPAYPCLGLFQLNNDGKVGACEADLRSTVTMLLMTYLTGRPGYISDPVVDTARNQIIYAHCVSTNKVFGPTGPANPYHIRNHSEDRKGAVVRSLMPLGEMTTTLEFDPVRKEVVMHQARTVANVDEDRACRTKLAAEVPDAQKLLSEWDRWGWHRVTFYGDWKRQVENVAALTGFKITYEG